MNFPLRVVETQILASPQNSVTFSGISSKVPSGSKHLIVLVNAQVNSAVNETNLMVRFNSDSAGNYYRQNMRGRAAVASASRQDAQTQMNVGTLPGTLVHASAFGGGYILIPNAFNTTTRKGVLASISSSYAVHGYVGTWDDTSAVDSIQVFLSGGVLQMAAGSRLILAVIDERMLLGQVDLAAPAGSIAFSSIQAGSGDLIAIGLLQTDFASTLDDLWWIVNGDTTDANYRRQRISGEDGSILSATAADRYCGGLISSVPGTTFSPVAMQISQHGRNGSFPTFVSLSGWHNSGSTGRVYAYEGQYEGSQAPITTLTFNKRGGTNFTANSQMSLYYVPRRSRLIERQVLQASAGSVTFSSIPTDFDGDEVIGLVLNVYARTDRAVVSEGCEVEFNGDTTGANYPSQELQGVGATPTANNTAGQGFDQIPGASAAAGVFGGGSIFIPYPNRTDRHKQRLALFGFVDTGGTETSLKAQRWANTGAITSIVLSPNTGPNFVEGSVFELEAVVAPSVDNEHLIFNVSHFDVTQNITYPGTWRTFPIITVTGPMKNLSITNVTTGQVIKLSYDLPVGKSLTIDLTTGQKTVVDSDGINRIGTVTSDSELGDWHIAPSPLAPNGVNQILIEGDLMLPNVTQVLISYNIRYFGI